MCAPVFPILPHTWITGIGTKPTWPSGWQSCPRQEVGTRQSLSSLPTQTIPWVYASESMIFLIFQFEIKNSLLSWETLVPPLQERHRWDAEGCRNVTWAQVTDCSLSFLVSFATLQIPWSVQAVCISVRNLLNRYYTSFSANKECHQHPSKQWGGNV